MHIKSEILKKLWYFTHLFVTLWHERTNQLDRLGKGMVHDGGGV
jgi:hypothetical protein